MPAFEEVVFEEAFVPVGDIVLAALAFALAVLASFEEAFVPVASASVARAAFVVACFASAELVADSPLVLGRDFVQVACLEPSAEDRYFAAASVDIADFVVALPTPPVIVVKFLLHYLANFFLFVILCGVPVERPPQ